MPRLKRNLLPNQAKRIRIVPPAFPHFPTFGIGRTSFSSLDSRPGAYTGTQYQYMRPATHESWYSRQETIQRHLTGLVGDSCAPVVDHPALRIGQSVRAMCPEKYDAAFGSLVDGQFKAYGIPSETVHPRLFYHYDRYVGSFRKPTRVDPSKSADVSTVSETSEDESEGSSEMNVEGSKKEVDRGVFPYVTDSSGYRVRNFSILDIFRTRHRINKMCQPKWFKYRLWFRKHRTRVRAALRLNRAQGNVIKKPVR